MKLETTSELRYSRARTYLRGWSPHLSWLWAARLEAAPFQNSALRRDCRRAVSGWGQRQRQRAECPLHTSKTAQQVPHRSFGPIRNDIAFIEHFRSAGASGTAWSRTLSRRFMKWFSKKKARIIRSGPFLV